MKKLLLSSLFVLPLIFNAQQKFSIIPSVGYAWRTAKTVDGLSAEEKDYVKKLKSGLNFDISAYYHLKPEIGIGLKFSSFSSSSNGTIIINEYTDEAFYGKVTTKDKITFFGPAFMYSNFGVATKHKLYYDIGLGMITYTSDTNGIVSKGSNLGLDANLAYQYEVSDRFYIGPKLGYTVGTLTKVKVNGQSYDLGDNKEGLGRISLALSATIRL